MCWRGPDADEMDDAECGCHAKGMLTAGGSGVGSDFQRRPQAVTVRGPAWALIDQAWGVHGGQVKRRGRRQEGSGSARNRTRAEQN